MLLPGMLPLSILGHSSLVLCGQHLVQCIVGYNVFEERRSGGSGKKTEGRKTKEGKDRRKRTKTKKKTLLEAPASYLFFCPSDNHYPAHLYVMIAHRIRLILAGPGPLATSGDSHRPLSSAAAAGTRVRSAVAPLECRHEQDGADSAFTGVSKVPKAGVVSSVW